MKESITTESVRLEGYLQDWETKTEITVNSDSPSTTYPVLTIEEGINVFHIEKENVKKLYDFIGYYLNEFPKDNTEPPEINTVISNHKRFINSLKDEDGYFRK